MGRAAVAKWSRLHQAAGVCPQAYGRCANVSIAGGANRRGPSPEVYGDFNKAKGLVSVPRSLRGLRQCRPKGGPLRVAGKSRVSVPRMSGPKMSFPRRYFPKILRPSAVGGGVRVFHSENVGTCPHTAPDRKLRYLSPAMVPPPSPGFCLTTNRSCLSPDTNRSCLSPEVYRKMAAGAKM